MVAAPHQSLANIDGDTRKRGTHDARTPQMASHQFGILL
jgi:hypothetical protein